MMIRIIQFCLFLGCQLVGLSPAVTGQQVTFRFFSEEVTLHYAPDLLPPGPARITEAELVAFYQDLTTRPYQSLLSGLQSERERLILNDWLFFRLTQDALTAAFPAHSSLQRDLTCWFLLSQAGFDTRLTYFEDEIYIYVYTQDEVFEAPMIEDQGRPFVNLSSIHEPYPAGRSLYLLNFAPNPSGHPFGFYLRQLPELKPQPFRQTYRFIHRDTTHELTVSADRTIAEVMEEYPFISEGQYLEVPLSRTLAASLLPQLQRLIAGKSPREAVELLVAFTRNAFVYQEDKEFFGRSKPMIAEEVFHYPVSDCEDRSALFYMLARELLDLPMIIVAFPDHLTIGVALEQLQGPIIRHRNRHYFICDPTGPVNSSEIGNFPQGYENQPFKIIGEHR